MLRFLFGVAVGASFATIAGRLYREHQKQRLVDQIAKLHEHEDRNPPGI